MADWKKTVYDYLISRDNYKCSLCGKELKERTKHDIDHIVERCDGGTDDMSNLRVVHIGCHRKRHARISYQRKRDDRKRIGASVISVELMRLISGSSMHTNGKQGKVKE